MEKKTKIDLLAIQLGSELGALEANINKVEKLLEDSLSIRTADFVFCQRSGRLAGIVYLFRTVQKC